MFGVVGDGRQVIDLAVVVDDAHAALATTESQFRLTVPAGHAAYPALVNMFAADLQVQSAKVWADIKTGDYTAAARIPFWSWAQRQGEVMDLLHPHREEKGFLFTWPLVANVLPL